MGMRLAPVSDTGRTRNAIVILTGILDDRYEHPRRVVDQVRDDRLSGRCRQAQRDRFLRRGRSHRVAVHGLHGAAATFPATQPRPEPQAAVARLSRAATFVAGDQQCRGRKPDAAAAAATAAVIATTIGAAPAAVVVPQ